MNRNIKDWEEIKNEFRPKVRYWLPCAAMDRDDLVAEIEALQRRGFGGVEIVTLHLPPEIENSEEGWGRGNWNEFVRLIADTTERLGMSMDLANGPMWPISMPTVKSADDPAALIELTWGATALDPGECSYQGPLPARRTIREEGTPKLIAAMAYLEVSDHVLRQESFVDLMPCISDGDTADSPKTGPAALDSLRLNVSLPEPPEGAKWLIFAFYEQPAVHKTGNGEYYVVDHLSKAGVKAVEEYWTPILEKYNYPSLESFFCDSLEYAVMYEWTPEFPEKFEEFCGYSSLPYLPFMGYPVWFPCSDIPLYRLEDSAVSDMMNRDYTETLTRLYTDNHLTGLENFAEKYGHTIRYQTAYNKPFEGERCPMFVGVPENEALGRPAFDYLKTMAAAAHLTRKPRYSFECAAEFGHAYGQTADDLMWWVKRSLMSGMNAQVLHGASYSGGYHGKYSENGAMSGLSWPGYEGFGKYVSNNWNRTLSEEHERGVLDAVARLNMVFRKTAKVDIAVYRDSYENGGLGSEFCFYEDDGALMNAGYSYETISAFLLDLPVCQVREGLLDAEGISYQALVIPETEHCSLSFLKRVTALLQDGFPVVWVGNPPEHAEFYGEWTEEGQEEFSELTEALFNEPALLRAETKAEVPGLLKKAGILPRVMLSGDRDLVTAVREDPADGSRYYALYAYNRVRLDQEHPNPAEISVSSFYYGTKSTWKRAGDGSRENVSIRLTDPALSGDESFFLCDYWTGKCRRIPAAFETNAETGRREAVIEIALEEDEMLILRAEKSADQEEACRVPAEVKEVIPLTFDKLSLYEFGPDTPEEVSFLRSGFKKEPLVFELSGNAETALKPWAALDPSLAKFAGKGMYTGHFTVDAETMQEGARMELSLGEVQDTFRVWINGTETDFPDQVLKKADITGLVCPGENSFTVEVVSNLYNRLQKSEDSNDPMVPFRIPYTEQNYGILSCGMLPALLVF